MFHLEEYEIYTPTHLQNILPFLIIHYTYFGHVLGTYYSVDLFVANCRYIGSVCYA